MTLTLCSLQENYTEESDELFRGEKYTLLVLIGYGAVI